MVKPRVVMKRAMRGLYEGRCISFGNKVSEDGGNKSRRCWKPNVQRKRLYSIAMDRYVQIRVTTHALRCMDRAGGFDQYMLRKKEKDLGERFIYWKRYIQSLYEPKEKLEKMIRRRITKNFREMHKAQESEEDPALGQALEKLTVREKVLSPSERFPWLDFGESGTYAEADERDLQEPIESSLLGSKEEPTPQIQRRSQI